jgi:diguanylate cyclase
MFLSLRTRLTVLYAGLFGVTLAVMTGAVFVAVSKSAEANARQELVAMSAVIDRIWGMRVDRMRGSASVLVRDFGFRAAANTGDVATITSATENLRRRIGASEVFILTPEGGVIGEDPAKLADGTARLRNALIESERHQGIAVLGGEPHQVVSVPLSPGEDAGWLVVAMDLKAKETAELERLSGAPLAMSILHRRVGEPWIIEGSAHPNDKAALGDFVDQAMAETDVAPKRIKLASGEAIVFVKTLPRMSREGSAALVLSFSMRAAMAPYQTLLILVVAIGVAGLGVGAWGSWVLARSVTRPIRALDRAVHRLQRGDDAQVEVSADDEIGRLAESFNGMVASIRERERRITHLAMHDEETGLPNRLALERTLEGLHDWSKGQVYVVALGFQRFEHVRGAIGYQLAAQALRMIGNRLAGLAPSAGAARIATDVMGFTMIASSPEAALDDARRLLAKLEHPIRLGGESVDVALDLGLAPAAGRQPSASIDLANIALDQVRGARRKVGLFDPEAYGDPASNLSLMSNMLQALGTDEISLFYQPKFDLRRRAVVGVEALSRWRHPARGMLPPDLFIPMAEETGHIRALTEWVVQRALADQRTLIEAGHRLTMSVNISGRTLGEPDFVEFAEAQARAAAGELCFEVTETSVIENPEVALAMLDRFADAGIAISIDDFGVGLSSLAYLKQIRGQELKIDKSIIQGIAGSQRDALIVRSTIDLAHSLGLKVVAEGVETNACFSLLAALGCDLAQGYLIAKPQSLEDLRGFLAEDRADLASTA